MTAVRPPGRFGAILAEGDRVTGFQEKPRGDGGWINGGFFVCSPKVGDYIEGDCDGLGARTPGAAGRRRPTRRRIFTTASGSRWTPCAIAGSSRSCGRPAGRRGRCGRRDHRRMRILVTGNQGYIGPVLGRHLRRNFLARGCSASTPAILPLARPAPRSRRSASMTRRSTATCATFRASLLPASMQSWRWRRSPTIRWARLMQRSPTRSTAAASCGWRRWRLRPASNISCSLRAAASMVLRRARPRKESDPLNPQTAYARSKIETERALAAMDLEGMTTTCLRFATACGMSDRLRLDLVLNDFVACAVAARKITVLSDGTPWRPLIDVRDMARAIEWAITRDAGKWRRAGSRSMSAPTTGIIRCAISPTQSPRPFRALRSASTSRRSQTRDPTRSTSRSLPSWPRRISRK